MLLPNIQSTLLVFQEHVSVFFVGEWEKVCVDVWMRKGERECACIVYEGIVRVCACAMIVIVWKCVWTFVCVGMFKCELDWDRVRRLQQVMIYNCSMCKILVISFPNPHQHSFIVENVSRFIALCLFAFQETIPQIYFSLERGQLSFRNSKLDHGEWNIFCSKKFGVVKGHLKRNYTWHFFGTILPPSPRVTCAYISSFST